MGVGLVIRWFSPPSDWIHFFFETFFFGKIEMPKKNGENHMKEQNESFQMVYGLLSKF
jgi:hypothetical protein